MATRNIPQAFPLCAHFTWRLDKHVMFPNLLIVTSQLVMAPSDWLVHAPITTSNSSFKVLLMACCWKHHDFTAGYDVVILFPMLQEDWFSF